MSYDLNIETHPGNSPSLEVINSVKKQLTSSMTDFPGASLIVHNDDPDGIKWFLEADGLYDPKCKQAFLDYCLNIGVAPEPLTPELAQRFWNATEGRTIATVSLPRDRPTATACFQFLLTLVKEHELRLTDPQVGCDIDLNSTSETLPYDMHKMSSDRITLDDAHKLLETFGISKPTKAYERWLKDYGFDLDDFDEVLNESDFIYWLDWRGELSSFLEYLENILNEFEITISYETEEISEHTKGTITHGDKTVEVKYSPANNDNFIDEVIKKVQSVLPENLEIRQWAHNEGSDTLGIAFLEAKEWKLVESVASDFIGENWIKLDNMGFDTSWIAIDYTDKDFLDESNALQTGLVEIPEYIEYKYSEQFLIAQNSHNSTGFDDINLSTLSKNRILYLVKVHEGVMYSSAECWELGELSWKIYYDSKKEKEILHGKGDIPELAYSLIANADEKSKEHSSTMKADHHHRVPSELMEKLVGYAHDTDNSAWRKI